jgi:hypothetical protein
MVAYSSKVLRTEMASRGWSVGDLAEALGLPRKSTTPYGWLAGHMPREDMRRKLAELFTNGVDKEPAMSEIQKQTAIELAMTALGQAERQFTFYAEHHYEKGATDKAATNYGYAVVGGNALERLKLVFGSDRL